MRFQLFERWRADAVNLMALTCLQASNAVIPLLIVPFAIARLGAIAYADVAIAEAVSMIAVAAVLYSFEVDGVSRIVGFRVDTHRDQLATVLSTILAARLAIFAVIATILLTVTSLFTALNPALLACWLLIALGQVFHSYWFYQGIEFNIPPALLTLVARFSSLALVVTFVHSASDRLIVPLAVGAPFAIAGLASLIYKTRVLGVRLRWPGLRAVRDYLTHGGRIFTGTAAVMLYRELNVLIMGVAGVPAAAISSYSLAEKSIKMIQAITRPLNQIAFPKVLRALHDHDRPDRSAARTIMRYTIPQIALVAIVIIALGLGFDRLADYSSALARFKALPDFGLLFAIIAPAPLFGLANFMLGSAGLNFLKDQRYYLGAILVTGIASVSACFVLSGLFGAVGAAIAFVGAEFVLLLMVVNRYKARSSGIAMELGS
jgi:PST family polysaccharide transporter